MKKEKSKSVVLEVQNIKAETAEDKKCCGCSCSEKDPKFMKKIIKK